MGKWKEIAKINSLPSTDTRLRAREVVDKNGKPYLAVEIYEDSSVDVTEECTAELVRSQHSGGFYCSIIHDDKSIIALGIDDASKCIVQRGYKLVKADGAVVSFRVIKES